MMIYDERCEFYEKKTFCSKKGQSGIFQSVTDENVLSENSDLTQNGNIHGQRKIGGNFLEK